MSGRPATSRRRHRLGQGPPDPVQERVGASPAAAGLSGRLGQLGVHVGRSGFEPLVEVVELSVDVPDLEAGLSEPGSQVPDALVVAREGLALHEVYVDLERDQSLVEHVASLDDGT